MIIQATDDEWNILCKNRMVKIKEGRTILELDGIDIPIQRQTDLIEDRSLLYSTTSSYDADFKKFVSEFPTSDAFENFKETRSDLRKDTKNVAKSRYIVLRVQHKLSADDILKALQHEIKRRKETSRLKGLNDLTYMNGLPVWLNNVTNIQGQLVDADKPVTQVNHSLFDDV